MDGQKIDWKRCLWDRLPATDLHRVIRHLPDELRQHVPGSGRLSDESLRETLGALPEALQQRLFSHIGLTTLARIGWTRACVDCGAPILDQVCCQNRTRWKPPEVPA